MSQHLSDADREYLKFILSLDDDEFQMLLNTMSMDDAREVLYLVSLAKEELFDQEMEIEGTPDADSVLDRVKKGIDGN